jgi:hypothetical protein
MPKSKHRKDHKKKVAARRQRLDEKRKAFYNMKSQKEKWFMTVTSKWKK